MTAPTYEKLTPPKAGTRVTVDAGGRWNIPDDPIVCLLRGDGIGRDVGSVPGITACAVKVLDAAVAKAYGGKKKIDWFDVHAGDVAREMYYPQVKDEQVGTLSEEQQRQLYLPDDTLKAFEYLQPRPQRAADHAHRRRLPQHQRLPPHPLRPLCLRPAGALLQGRRGAEQTGRQGRHGHLPREHRGRVLRHRVQERLRQGEEGDRPAQGDGLQRRALVRHRHQADESGGQQTPHPHGDPVRPRQEAAQRDADAQGQHHEVHRGRFKEWGYELASEEFRARPSARTR